MVGVLIRMKLRVLRHSTRGPQAVALALGAALGTLAALATLTIGAVEFTNPNASVDLIAATYLLWTIGWLVGPILTGGGDETLRPEHFALLPVPPRRLAVGLLGAGFVGVPAIVSIVAFGGLIVFGARLGGVAVLVALVAMPLQLVLVVLLSRVVMAALGGVLRSRRGRDIGFLLAALVGMSGFAAQYLFTGLGPAIAEGRSATFSTVLRALPSGWGTVAVDAAARSNAGGTLAAMAGLVVLIVVLVVLWAVLLERRMTTVAASSGDRRAAQGRGGTRRGMLPDTPIGAVVGKELRTWWRDARRRVALLSMVLVGVLVPVAPSLGTGEFGLVPFVAVFLAGFGCLQAGNLYGFDGSALWHTLVVPGAEHADVRGRQLAWLLIVAPLTVVLAIVLPAVASAPWAYPWVLGLVPVLLGAGAGLIMLLSVFAGYPMPDQRGNLFAAGANPGCARALLQLAMGLLLAVAAAPVVLVVAIGSVASLDVLRWLGVPVGVGTGILFGWWWGRLAVRRLSERGPELLALVAKAS